MRKKKKSATSLKRISAPEAKRLVTNRRQFRTWKIENKKKEAQKTYCRQK